MHAYTLYVFYFINVSSAQAFQDIFSDFDAWLRETERKIQRDDPLKLEVKELKDGLSYLQVHVWQY